MHLWMVAYIVLALFDIVITYIFINGGQFGIEDEGNTLIRSLMGRYGIWQGLTIYLIQDLVIFFLIWGCFYYILKHLLKDRPHQLVSKVDIIIFNLGIPFFIMASALLHLFGGIFWLVLGITGALEMWFPLKFITYITIICGLSQAYYAIKLNFKEPSGANPRLI